jgi:3-phosphoshikimate 1-carboxyvinyltransferase
MALNYIAQAATRLTGTARVPGDKSISHRSVMLGSIANGVTRVSGFLSGADAIATMQAFRAMGVQIEHMDDRLEIHGVGRDGLSAPEEDIDLGNSGTAMRLMMGLLSGQRFDVRLTGDASLCSRPMGRIVVPLSGMGATFQTSNGMAPLGIIGSSDDAGALRAIEYELPMASAQVKSAILLAGLYANGRTCVTEPAPTRDHTERMLRGFGYEVHTDGARICLSGGGALIATDIDVPADISSAAFFMVGACISSGSQLCLRHVGINPTRIGIINILKMMGASIEYENQKEIGGEPVADIVVKASALKGVNIPEQWVPLAIDEIPVIAIAAACAQGETRLTGAAELRVKESDRIMAIVSALTALGVEARETPDGFVIQGKGAAQHSTQPTAVFNAGTVQSHDDHRIAMACSIASLRADGPILIENCANVTTSFPGYIELANSIGLGLIASES